MKINETVLWLAFWLMVLVCAAGMVLGAVKGCLNNAIQRDLRQPICDKQACDELRE